MMNFRIIRQGIIDLLGAAAAGQYVVLGYQAMGQRAEELLGVNRQVQVYYSTGEYPKSKSSLNGPTQHDMAFVLDCMCSEQAEVDLSALTNPAATPAEKAAALAASRPAAELAGNSWDELYDILYQIIMDARNIDLGLGFKIANRWIPRVDKDDPIPAGDLCVITGTIRLECSIDEQVPGDTPVAAVDGITTDFETTDEEDAYMGVDNEYVLDV